MAKNHGAQIKDDDKYEALRGKGMSKGKAARIANSGSQSASRGGRHAGYEDWSKQDLYDKAKQVGIAGRSQMKKSELIDALRHH